MSSIRPTAAILPRPEPGPGIAHRRILVLGAARRAQISPDLPCHVVFDPDQSFDALVVLDDDGADAVAGILRQRGALLAPVGHVSRRPLWFADVGLADASPAGIRRVVEDLLGIVDALETLPDDSAVAADPDLALLVRMYSRRRPLQPVYDATSPEFVRYPLAGLIPEPRTVAERLADSGQLARHFFDRLHACAACGSSRLNVREECTACRSADVVERAVLHHFRCAHQAPEQDFRRGRDLVCPKCDRRLRHLGVDYDRPAPMTLCRSCGAADTEPSVGFVCMDCGVRSDAAAVGTRVWSRYELTAAGEHRLLSGRGWRSADDGALPALAEHWLRIQSRYGRPGTVLRVSYTGLEAARRELGARGLAIARDRAAEIARGELRDTDFIVESADGLLIVLPETDATAVDVPRRRLRERITSALAVELGVEIRRIDAAEVLAWTDRRR